MSARTIGVPVGVTGTVGTSSALALAANTVRQFFQIINNSTTVAGNTLAFTLDGTTPTVNGNGITLNPGGSATYDVVSPTGAINVIGSAASTPYQIYWL